MKTKEETTWEHIFDEAAGLTHGGNHLTLNDLDWFERTRVLDDETRKVVAHVRYVISSALAAAAYRF